jgi:tetratricopeptide (TPR) repeat protein
MSELSEPTVTHRAALEGAQISGTGVVAGGSVYLTGDYVAGRDLIINQSFVPPAEVTGGLFQLPPEVADFTGREDAVATITGWLTEHRNAPAAAVFVGISGMAGVGKTALALHVAHRVSDLYPDGQLYVNLRGVEAEHLDPATVLAGFLHAFGVQVTAIPAGLDARSSMYRGMLAGKKVLVVLDNAASEAQVRPLLPGADTCAAVVTSRTQLIALEGARSYVLRVMTPASALELLGKIVGADRAAAESSAAQRIVALCGYLPLAVRIASARLAARPHWRLARLLTRLEREYQRLEELEAGDLSVRASFALTYSALSEDERAAFCLLGLVRAPDFAAWVLAALLDSDTQTAEDLSERLVDVQLLESDGEDSTGNLRFHFHDLLRSFAREQLTEHGRDTGAALQRLLGAYLALSKRALYLLSPNSKRDLLAPRALPWVPQDVDVDALLGPDPLDWFVAEEAGIVSAVGQAYEAQVWDMTWELADPLHYHFRVLARWTDWVATHELALEAAQRAGNRRGEACILRNLGNAYRDRGQLAKAIECYQAGLQIATGLDSGLLRAFMLNGLGEVSLDRGRIADASAHFEDSLPLWAAAEDLTGVAYAHTHLAMVLLEQDRLAEAMTHAERSLVMQREFRDPSGEGYALTAIGDIHREHGELDAALSRYDEALRIYRDRETRLAEADVVARTGWVRLEQGSVVAAARAFGQALPVYLEYGQRRGEGEAMAGLGAVEASQRSFDVAIRHLDRAKDLASGLDDVLLQARALRLLGDTHSQMGEAQQATSDWCEALDRFEEAGSAQAESVRRLIEDRK